MLKTMAVKITEDNYPIAVACLAAGFATYPVKEVVGCYLVINELGVDTFKHEGDRPFLVVGNSWMTEKLFNETYQFVEDMNDPKEFGEIIKL